VHGGFVLEQTMQVDRQHRAGNPAEAAGDRLAKRPERLGGAVPDLVSVEVDAREVRPRLRH
jgi:hypothetical protein